MRVPVTEKYERNGWPSVERPEGWNGKVSIKPIFIDTSAV